MKQTESNLLTPPAKADLLVLGVYIDILTDIVHLLSDIVGFFSDLIDLFSAGSE